MRTTETDAALVVRAMQRDADAFGELYDRYFDKIYRYARLRVGNAADAEDIAAAVFLNAWRAIDRFSPKHEASFASWLFRMAHNAIVDRYRRARDELSLDTSGVMPEESSAPKSPEALLEWRLTLDELHRALLALTSEQRDVVLLRFVEGLSAREVGEIMGKQEGTVRGMQYRAIEALRRVLIQPKQPKRERSRE